VHVDRSVFGFSSSSGALVTNDPLGGLSYDVVGELRRLVKLADMLVWVLDPLKYADASVHRRYLVPLAGHAAVTTVVLNQVDTLSPDQASDCETDLRRLLDAEGLTETQVIVTSATPSFTSIP